MSTTEHPDLPPVVYVPTTIGDDAQPRLAMKVLADERTAVFAYSALDRLRDFYSPDTSWALLTQRDLQKAHDDVAFDVLFLDQRLRTSAAGAEGSR